ncbi:hypothetical protein PIB30_098328 [Stylosanthes scabra]|uniref:Uncharacterized protein n=1 Tax=Stylosanthes scabra TaxID=79078 RepID=A0ABU6YX63_9FABA|nr:hypothetical protein [Stylosanthes scabra]
MIDQCLILIDAYQMDRKGKQVASKGKEKMYTPPTRASPRLAALRASSSTASPSAAPKSQEVLPTNQGTHEATNTELPRATKIRRTERISMKPIEGRFARRLAERTTPSKDTPKGKVLNVLSNDDELEVKIEDHTTELVETDEAIQERKEEEEEEEEDPKELPEEELQDF